MGRDICLLISHLPIFPMENDLYRGARYVVILEKHESKGEVKQEVCWTNARMILSLLPYFASRPLVSSMTCLPARIDHVPYGYIGLRADSDCMLSSFLSGCNPPPE